MTSLVQITAPVAFTKPSLTSFGLLTERVQMMCGWFRQRNAGPLMSPVVRVQFPPSSESLQTQIEGDVNA